jgi:hypothetical protein
MSQNEFLFELRNGIIGIWDNTDLRLSFSGDGVNDGTVIINNKINNVDVGANYKIIIKEDRSYLQIISKEEGVKSFQEFIISSLDPTTEKKIILSSPFGIVISLNRLD